MNPNTNDGGENQHIKTSLKMKSYLSKPNLRNLKRPINSNETTATSSKNISPRKKGNITQTRSRKEERNIAQTRLSRKEEDKTIVSSHEVHLKSSSPILSPSVSTSKLTNKKRNVTQTITSHNEMVDLQHHTISLGEFIKKLKESNSSTKTVIPQHKILEKDQFLQRLNYLTTHRNIESTTNNKSIICQFKDGTKIDSNINPTNPTVTKQNNSLIRNDQESIVIDKNSQKSKSVVSDTHDINKSIEIINTNQNNMRQIDTKQNDVRKIDTNQNDIKPIDTKQKDVRQIDANQNNIKQIDSNENNIKQIDNNENNIKQNENNIKQIDTNENNIKQIDTIENNIKQIETNENNIKQFYTIENIKNKINNTFDSDDDFEEIDLNEPQKEIDACIKTRSRKKSNFNQLADKIINIPNWRDKICLNDLMYFNLSANPSTLKTNSSIRKWNSNEIILSDKETSDEEEIDTPEPVPQLKVSGGKLIVDPTSLIIKPTKLQRCHSKSLEQLFENDERRSKQKKPRKPHKQWTPEETVEFYKALNNIGSDFTAMASILDRTRAQIKYKFKLEDSKNSDLITKAMMNMNFSVEELEKRILLKKNNDEKRKKASKVYHITNSSNWLAPINAQLRRYTNKKTKKQKESANIYNAMYKDIIEIIPIRDEITDKLINGKLTEKEAKIELKEKTQTLTKKLKRKEANMERQKKKHKH